MVVTGVLLGRTVSQVSGVMVVHLKQPVWMTTVLRLDSSRSAQKMIEIFHIVVAMKPLKSKNFSESAVSDGVAGLNVDGCRVGTDDKLNGGAYAKNGIQRKDGWGMQRAGEGEFQQSQGRWPANVILSHTQECKHLGQKRVKGSGTSKTFHESYDGDSNT